MLRVSSKTSLMAAHAASVSTTIHSSTSSRARRNVSAPTRLTAVPSENRPTSASSTRSPASIDRIIASESFIWTPIDADLRPHRLDVGRDARDQAAAADGDEDGVDRALVLAQDLHRDRSLAGDHVGIVERMDEGERTLGLERQRAGVGVRIAVAEEDDLGAERAHGVDLERRRRRRHDDERVAAEAARRQRDPLRVVARRGADHAARERRGRRGGPSCCTRRAA